MEKTRTVTKERPEQRLKFTDQHLMNVARKIISNQINSSENSIFAVLEESKDSSFQYAGGEMSGDFGQILQQNISLSSH